VTPEGLQRGSLDNVFW